MPVKAKRRPVYLTDGTRLLRVECELSGGRGVIVEDCYRNTLISLPIKEFLQLRKVER